MIKMIEISLDEYINLKTRDLRLGYLECGGVDNWGGYGESLYPDDEDEVDFDVAVEDMEKELNEKFNR